MSKEKITILVTRPEPYGRILCEQIENAGDIAIYLPTIIFVPISVRVDLSKQNYEWIIFASQEAVLQSAHFIKPFNISSKTTRIASIGESTARALIKMGIENVIYPLENWTSEGLLELDEFHKVKLQKILLVHGEGGRDMLAEVLTARGAIVEHLSVYRRVVPVYDNISPYLALLRQKKIDIIVCTSGESLHNLMTILGTDNRSLLAEVAIIVVSARLVDLAKQLHFQHVYQAKNASHPAMMDTISMIKGNGYVR